MDDTIVPIGDPENMEHHHTPRQGRRPLSLLPARTPFCPSVMLRCVRLCNQRSLQPVPDHPLVPVLIVSDEPDEPLLCGTIETELEPDSLDTGVLHILLCIRSDNSIHHQLMYRKIQFHADTDISLHARYIRYA